MRRTFLDPELEAQLDRDGYVVVPLLSRPEVERLVAAYEQLGAAPGDPQRACVDTFHCFDASYKEAVHHEVEGVLRPRVQLLFDRYKSLSYCYIQKWPGERSTFGIHQDISVLDETAYRSVEVWTALADTSEENGQLWVVPGSHRWAPRSVRGIHGFPPPYAGLEHRILQRHSIPVPVHAGDAVIFCHSLLHFSFENRSGSFRLVAATDMIPEEAQHLHWVANAKGTIDEFEIDESFWVEQNPFTLMRAPAHLNKVGEVDPADLPRLTDEDLDEMVRAGELIDHDALPFERINADLVWCHRCGTTDGVEGKVDPFNGNMTVLCPRCDVAQARMAGIIGGIDPKVLDSLATDGYAVVDLFGEKEVAQLVGPETASESAAGIVQHAVDRTLTGYALARLSVALGCIDAEIAGDPALHQDRQYVDERYHRSVSGWAPLTAPAETTVVPNSHRWSDHPRGVGIHDPFTLVRDEVERRAGSAVAVSPGQALIFDSALLHRVPAVAAASFVIAPPAAGILQVRSVGDLAEVLSLPTTGACLPEEAFDAPAGAAMRTLRIDARSATMEDLDGWVPAADGGGTVSAATPPRVSRWRRGVRALRALDYHR